VCNCYRFTQEKEKKRRKFLPYLICQTGMIYFFPWKTKDILKKIKINKYWLFHAN